MTTWRSPGRFRSLRRRGSALILVVVSLVLMTIIGAAYIQAARVDRAATREVVRATDVDVVVQSALSQIQLVLRDDLINGSGDLFNPAIANGGADEPYDYPWTNSTVDLMPEPRKNDGSAFTPRPKGGQFDDMWLASTTPDFSGTDPVWPHITNLNGVFLRLPTTGGSQSFPEENPINFTAPSLAYLKTDGGVKITSTGGDALGTAPTSDWQRWGVDADGDGIWDSRWTWAPTREIDGTMYVMAVRIIDNSSLINAGVALSLVDIDGAHDASGPDEPRWWSPSELDLGGFVHRYTNVTLGLPNAADFMSELRGLLQYRIQDDIAPPPTLPIPWGGSVSQRDHFWLNGPALYHNYQAPYRWLTVQDEFELRYRNGLNNPDSIAVIEDEMPKLLRRDAGVEYAYSDVPQVASVQDYFWKNPRQQMTVTSGAAIYAPPLPGETGVVFKSDLNSQTATTLSARIKEVFDGGAGGSPLPIPLIYPGGWTTQELADQFAVCITDYKDTDNRLTMLNNRYGMEALPFIAEVYTQGRYVVSTATFTATTLPNGDWDIVWTPQGNAGYAIEIRNPFRQDIELTDVHLWVGGTDWGSLDVLAGTPDLGPDEVLILYRDSNNKVSSDDNVTQLWSASNPDINDVAINKNWPSGTGVVNVELRAAGDGGSPLVWAYAVAPCDAMPTTELQTFAGVAGTPPVAVGTANYRQRTSIGNGNGLNVATVRSGDFDQFNKQDLNLPVPMPIRSTSLDALGEADKTAKGPSNSFAADSEQVLIADRDEIVQVGELGHMAMLGPDATRTFADMWNGATSARAFMLDFSSNTVIGTNDHAVPHAVMLMERFTTLSPLTDGQDNDGDGQADGADPQGDEQFVPGTININTVSGDLSAVTAQAHLLQSVLPIQDPAVKDNVIRAIIRFRDRLAPFGGVGRGVVGYRDAPGLAHVAELTRCVDPSSNDSIDVLAKPNHAKYGKLGSPGTYADTWQLHDGSNGFVVDFMPDPSTADGIADDREEELMLARSLGQVFTTRSDIFTAYVLIQGFPADDFRKGPVASARFMAIFDRSRITGPNDTVRVLGVYRMN